MIFQTSGDYNLTVYVPEKYDKNLSFELSSGNIKMENFVLNKINCDLSSGNVMFNDIIAENINLNLSSGDVEFKNVTTEKK